MIHVLALTVVTNFVLPSQSFVPSQSHSFGVACFGLKTRKCQPYILSKLLNADTQNDQEKSDDVDKAQLEWLERTLSNTDKKNSQNINPTETDELSATQFIPKTGISISDEIESIQSTEKFQTRLVPYQTPGLARIETFTDSVGEEVNRYLVALQEQNDDDDTEDLLQYVMVDVPPFSEELAAQINNFISPSTSSDNFVTNLNKRNGTLSAILVTCQDCIHYDEQPAVYVTRKNDLMSWKKAFPQLKIIMYRLDTPRDCNDVVTKYGQILDGYGPWALEDNSNNIEDSTNNAKFNFVETGRPLTRVLWDENTQAKVLDDGEIPPDDNDNEASMDEETIEDLYSPKAIRERENNKLILALYTPGHSFGSVCYIFPEREICCSGFALPIQDTRSQANSGGMLEAGPTLDYRGYLTTNKGGIQRQVESARHLINTYNDRFSIILPSRGPSTFLSDCGPIKRAQILNDALNEFRDTGEAYERLGIL